MTIRPGSDIQALLGTEMKQLSPRMRRLAICQLDAALRAVQTAPLPTGGWIRAIREALGMSRNQLAKRLGIARLNNLEGNEVSGGVTLARLQRAANALGCRLVYALVPKSSLEETVKLQAFRQAKFLLGHVNVSQVEDLAEEFMINRPRSLWDDYNPGRTEPTSAYGQ